MSVFAEARAALTDAVFETFGAAGVTLRPVGGGSASTVRAVLRRPTEGVRLSEAEVVLARPFVRVPVADASSLRKGDVLQGALDLGSDLVTAWRLEATPTRPGDGAVWEAPVSPVAVVP